MFYETKDAGHGMAIDPFKSLVVPRPIGWVTSLYDAGRVNLAPFSFFNAVAEDPPMVVFSPSGRKPDRPVKDSRANIEATKEFVCNLSTWDLREAMNATSAVLPAGVDEMKAAGLSLDEVMNVTSGNLPPYRFTYLIEKAKQHAGLVQQFGTQLQSALQQRDGEELTRLRNWAHGRARLASGDGPAAAAVARRKLELDS